MSLQRLPRRSVAARPPTEDAPNEKDPLAKRRLLQRHKSRNTRPRRIWDLLSHIPSFLLRFLRLLSFVVFLLPAFVVFVWHYVACDRVAAYYGGCPACAEEESSGKESDADSNCSAESDVDSGKKRCNCKDPFWSRHYLDVYGSRTPSPNPKGKKPVVIFLTGGAWIIGYKMWGCLLARSLAPFGVLVIVPDYRNFPRVNSKGMVRDVDMSIQWVFDRVEEYGGDKEKVVLVGQSAGAHIGGVVVAMKVWDWLRGERRAAMESSNTNGEVNLPRRATLKSTYTPQQLCGFVSTSSPVNLVTMRPVFHHHGLSADVQRSIFGGDDQSKEAGEDQEDVFEKWSPYHLMMKAHAEYLNLLSDANCSENPYLFGAFPRFCVIHGTSDKTVPVSEAIEFIALLTKLKVPTDVRMYKGWTHTDPILEAPMRGNHLYHRDIYELVRTWTGDDEAMKVWDDGHPMLRPICPSLLVEAARVCNPF